MAVAIGLLTTALHGGVGDPQIGTDHPWYPGELACSTFERLFATQAELYERVTGSEAGHRRAEGSGRLAVAEHALCHGEEGAEDLWGKGFNKGGDPRTREYWTGLFATASACAAPRTPSGSPRWRRCSATTAAAGRRRRAQFLRGLPDRRSLRRGQVGAARSRPFDVSSSTRTAQRCSQLRRCSGDWKRLTDRGHAPERQHGWPVCGLHPDDRNAFSEYNVAEYLAGYAGPPPMVHLRRGETLRRYLQPGLEDGKTFVFWGRNYNTAGIPGPERSHTWVNQPEKLLGSAKRSRTSRGRPATATRSSPTARLRGRLTAKASSCGGRNTGRSSSSARPTSSPPRPRRAPWGIYEPGGANGLVLHGNPSCAVSVSVDRGQTWQDGGKSRTAWI